MHSNDLVPHVPPSGFDGYKHAGKIVWYESTMEKGAKYLECEADQEEKCSNSSQTYSVIDHINYFDTVFVLDSLVGCKKWDLKQL